jgi:hypothetical protein
MLAARRVKSDAIVTAMPLDEITDAPRLMDVLELVERESAPVHTSRTYGTTWEPGVLFTAFPLDTVTRMRTPGILQVRFVQPLQMPWSRSMMSKRPSTKARRSRLAPREQ